MTYETKEFTFHMIHVKVVKVFLEFKVLKSTRI
mgnify:CR=1 FL=1